MTTIVGLICNKWHKVIHSNVWKAEGWIIVIIHPLFVEVPVSKGGLPSLMQFCVLPVWDKTYATNNQNILNYWSKRLCMFGQAHALCHICLQCVCAAATSENIMMEKNVKLLEKREGNNSMLLHTCITFVILFFFVCLFVFLLIGLMLTVCHCLASSRWIWSWEVNSN